MDIVCRMIVQNQVSNPTEEETICLSFETRKVFLRHLRTSKKLPEFVNDESHGYVDMRFPAARKRTTQLLDFRFNILYGTWDQIRTYFHCYYVGKDPYWPPERVLVLCPTLFGPESECCVCMDASGERTPRLACGHCVCRACFDAWLRVNSTCPLCRSPIAEDWGIADAFNATISKRPLGELWHIAPFVQRAVGVSIRSSRRRPCVVRADFDCVLDAQTFSGERLRTWSVPIRTKRLKTLYFISSPPALPSILGPVTYPFFYID